MSTFWCNSGHTSVGGTTFKLDPTPVETMKCSVAPVAHGCWARGAAWLQSGYLRRIGKIRRIFPNYAILRCAGVTCAEIFLHPRSVTCPTGPISKFRGRLNPRKSPGLRSIPELWHSVGPHFFGTGTVASPSSSSSHGRLEGLLRGIWVILDSPTRKGSAPC